MSQDVGACTEREITQPIDLCTADGRLNPDAVGWSRTPLHRCALPGSWGRRKRWDFWGFTGPNCAMNVTYADVDYLGLIDVWFCDFETGRVTTRSAPVPFGRGISMPHTVAGGPLTHQSSRLDLSILEDRNGTKLIATFKDFAADLFIERPPAHESLSVVIPWSPRRFQFTNKDVGRPMRGHVTCHGRPYDLERATLDFGRGKWPYRVQWNWGAGAGVVDGVDIGVQLGGKWTDGTGMTENGITVDGKLSKLSEELLWDYDTSDWLRPWTIRTPRSDRLDLTFTPIYDKRSRLSLGVASSRVDQCFGTYRGTVVPDDGRRLAIDGVFGWAEEATWRW